MAVENIEGQPANYDAHTDICPVFAHAVGNGVPLLPPQVGGHHHGTVGNGRYPNCPHITIAWYEDNVEHDGDDSTDTGDIQAKTGLVGQLIPYRQVHVNTKQHVVEQQDGDNEIGRAHV